jgi:methylmalonyl-CoA mutase
MTNHVNFTEEFSPPSYEAWRGEVDKALKGAPFDKKMTNKTYEGITLQPVYTRSDWPQHGDPSGFPGAMPFTRGQSASGNRVADWQVRQWSPIRSRRMPTKSSSETCSGASRR